MPREEPLGRAAFRSPGVSVETPFCPPVKREDSASRLAESSRCTRVMNEQYDYRILQFLGPGEAWAFGDPVVNIPVRHLPEGFGRGLPLRVRENMYRMKKRLPMTYRRASAQ